MTALIRNRRSSVRPWRLRGAGQGQAGYLSRERNLWGCERARWQRDGKQDMHGDGDGEMTRHVPRCHCNLIVGRVSPFSTYKRGKIARLQAFTLARQQFPADCEIAQLRGAWCERVAIVAANLALIVSAPNARPVRSAPRRTTQRGSRRIWKSACYSPRPPCPVSLSPALLLINEHWPGLHAYVSKAGRRRSARR